MTDQSGVTETADDLRRHARVLLGVESVPIAYLVKLSGRLRDHKDFELARLLLENARLVFDETCPDLESLADDDREFWEELDRTLREKQAVSTYKNPECIAEESLEAALGTLRGPDGPDLIESRSQETLGLAGAIHKRRWEVDGRVEHLLQSLEYYSRGWDRRRLGDYWYTGINAAFVLDLLAQEGTDKKEQIRRRRQAGRIRRQIVVDLKKQLAVAAHKDWWRVATLVEAHFGLGQYDEAQEALGQADLASVHDWERESTVRQLAALERIGPGRAEDGPNPDAVKVLNALVEGDASHIVATFGGKMGVALSGGGFRAAFFHLGVLARLAELDVLRHVEVLSCVSGGSIAGAQYYLRLRALLEKTPDRLMSREKYVSLVRAVQEDLVRAVATNIRFHVRLQPPHEEGPRSRSRPNVRGRQAPRPAPVLRVQRGETSVPAGGPGRATGG